MELSGAFLANQPPVAVSHGIAGRGERRYRGVELVRGDEEIEIPVGPGHPPVAELGEDGAFDNGPSDASRIQRRPDGLQRCLRSQVAHRVYVHLVQ